MKRALVACDICGNLSLMPKVFVPAPDTDLEAEENDAIPAIAPCGLLTEHETGEESCGGLQRFVGYVELRSPSDATV